VISIMGQAIPPEWIVNILALGKEPWNFKDLEDQLNMYRQQWQADQPNQIIAKMTDKMPGKPNDGKRKNNELNAHNNNGGDSCGCQGNNGSGGCIERGNDNNNNSDHLKTIKCYNCGKICHYLTDCAAPKKNGNENFNMVSKVDFKNVFQSSLKEMLSKKENKNKNKAHMELNDNSLDTTVFEKLMEGKHTEIVSDNDDDSMSIENTNNLFHFEKNNTPDEPCLKKLRITIMMTLFTNLVNELN
jgi:hypothetical protein